MPKDKPVKVDGKFRRNRPRVKGSWRDKAKGDCWTRGTVVVCEGSSGQAGVYKSRPHRTVDWRITRDKRRAKLSAKVDRLEKMYPDSTRHQLEVFAGGGEEPPTKPIREKTKWARQRGKEIDFDDLTIRSGSKTAPNKTAKGELYLEVVKPFGSSFVDKNKGLYKIKDIPSKKGTGASNTQKFNIFKKGKSGEEAQFNPYTAKGKKAIEDGSVRFVRKK